MSETGMNPEVNHERYSELCALAMSGTLSENETADLSQHLQTCGECRDDYERYLLLTQQGMPLLARLYAQQKHMHEPEQPISDAKTEQAFFARIAKSEMVEPQARAFGARRIATGIVAASVLLLTSLGVYRLIPPEAKTESSVAKNVAGPRLETLKNEKNSFDAERNKLIERLQAQSQGLASLEKQSDKKRQEIEDLRADLSAANQRALELASNAASTRAVLDEKDQKLRTASEQHDALMARLEESEEAYQSAQKELLNMRAERDRMKLRLVSLENDNSLLSAANRDQDRRLGDQERRLRTQEQYLDADRDIRELMGARQLYVADVFDVTSESRTRKPYGRVFYTQRQSLIFYAFDLDQQPGIKNASFQAWGRSESSQRVPVNLGILYLDNTQNRRWVLRFDDPRQLAEIDAVFVTVEPNGGSAKPSGKPFLYASLRREPNHP